MPDTIPTTSNHEFDAVREQIHDLSGGFREVAEALFVPAGIPEEEDDRRELVDPEDIRDSIIGDVLTEPADGSTDLLRQGGPRR